MDVIVFVFLLFSPDITLTLGCVSDWAVFGYDWPKERLKD